MKPSRIIPLLFVLGLMLAGCGYSAKPTFRADIRTVAVRIDNRTFYRGVEFDLTEALKKRIETTTPYKVTASENADSVMTATILKIESSAQSLTYHGGLPQDVEVTMMVDYKWQDARKGKTIDNARGLVAVGRFVPTRPVGETFASGQHMVVDRMADRLVAQLRGDW